MKKIQYSGKGITLVALVVTIVVLLILAAVSISTLTNNGIIRNAGKAKEETEIAEEKEVINSATTQAIGDNTLGNLVENELQEQLDNITDETVVSNAGEEIEVAFMDSKRYYVLNKDGNIIEERKIIEDKSPGDITEDQNGNNIDGDKPFEIWCIEDLVEWSQNYSTYLTADIKLCRTLNFKSNYSYTDGNVLSCNSVEELKDLLTNSAGSGFPP